jgi:hypothetical protein
MIKGSSTDKMKGKSETIQLLLPKAKGSAFGPASPDGMCYFCVLHCKTQSFTIGRGTDMPLLYLGKGVI